MGAGSCPSVAPASLLLTRAPCPPAWSDLELMRAVAIEQALLGDPGVVAPSLSHVERNWRSCTFTACLILRGETPAALTGEVVAHRFSKPVALSPDDLQRR